MMIRYLRIRILLMIMGIITIALTTLLIVLVSSSYQDALSDSYKTLDTIYLLVVNDSYNLDGITEDQYLSDQFESPNFFIILDENGLPLETFTNGTTYSDNDISSYASITFETNSQKGFLKEEGLVFKKYDENIIGFVDFASEEVHYKNKVVDYVTLIAGSFIAFLLASVYISKKVVTPVDLMVKKQRQFVMNASHELKTPLTVISSNASILFSNSNQENRKWIDNIYSESKYMQKLVQDLLELTEFDTIRNKDRFESVSVSDLINEVSLKFEPIMYEAGFVFQTSVCDGVLMKGIESDIKRLVVILLDNAKKYSDSGTEISLSLSQEKSKTIIEVRNFGKVISVQDKERIFDRFYKLDKSRTRSESGYGLGLSLAKEIVKIHDGIIELESNTELGTIFKVIFQM